MSNLISVGHSNQLVDALEKAGFTVEDVTKLLQFSKLKYVRDVIHGKAEIVYPEYLIDCDADAKIPEGYNWTVVEHRKMGNYKFNPVQLSLHFSKKQQASGFIEGDELRKELKDKKVLNSNVLWFLLDNPTLIPDEWKGKAVLFWGTIFRGSDGDLYVLYLRWDGSAWNWYDFWFGNDFDSSTPAVLASSL